MQIEKMRAQALEAVKRLPDEKIEALLDHLRSLGALRVRPSRQVVHERTTALRTASSAHQRGIMKYRGAIRVGAGDISHDIEQARKAMAAEANEY